MLCSPLKHAPAIWVGIPLTEAQRQQILAVAQHATVFQPPLRGLSAAMSEPADIALGWPYLKDAEASATLRWLQLRSAGTDPYGSSKALRRKGVILTTAQGVFNIPGAEHVFAMMLYFSRRLDQSGRQQRERIWDLEAVRPGIGELHGQTIAVFGLGGFGQEIARRAKAFGMRVLAVRRNLSEANENVDQVFPMSEAERVVAQADHVVLTLPDTPETRGFFDAELIGAMKPSAHFYNIARGSLVDEGALVRALQERRIAGAGLDVCQVEPIPADSPLWNLPQVLITPHTAGRSPHEFQRIVDLFCDNLRRFLAGEPLRNQFAFERGY